MSLSVQPVEFSDSVFAALLAEAPNAGGRFLLRLRDEWLSGATRFDRPGEVLLGAFIHREFVGIGGISCDPYDPVPGLGRVRHLYVLEKCRRCGIGRALMRNLLAHARAHFAVLRLSTQAPEAARLYESYGFTRAGGHRQTHRLEF